VVVTDVGRFCNTSHTCGTSRKENGGMAICSSAFLQTTWGLLLEKPCLCQIIHKQVKIDQPGVGFPSAQDNPHSSVVKRFPQLEPTCKIVSGPHIITGEDICPSQTAQKHILCRPAPNSTYFEQPIHCLPIINESQVFKIRISFYDCRRQFDESTGFTRAEPELLQLCHLCGSYLLRRWKEYWVSSSPRNGRPQASERRLSRVIPTAKLSCWHATPFAMVSKTVGNRGGFSP
jgi:hypothetical protein